MHFPTDVWTSSADFLALNAGDWEEHSILLCNYLTFLDQQETRNEVERQKKASRSKKSKLNKKDMDALSKQPGEKASDGDDENTIASSEKDRNSLAFEGADARAANYIVLGSEVPEGIYVCSTVDHDSLLERVTDIEISLILRSGFDPSLAGYRKSNSNISSAVAWSGSTVYVLRAAGNELLLFNSIFGQSYNVEDHFCPLQTVDLVANGAKPR